MILSRSAKAYTIVETMVAISLLMLGVGAAASLSMTLVKQEEINARAARAVNWQENAVRLYQMGIGGSTSGVSILDVLPTLPQSHTFTVQGSFESITDYPADIAQPEVANLTLVYSSDPGGGVTRTSVMKGVR
jgi:type II secretory pathway pseudopilin PulG